MNKKEWMIEQDKLNEMDDETYSRIFSIGNGFIGTLATDPLSGPNVHGTLIGGVHYKFKHTKESIKSVYVPEPGNNMRDNKNYPTDEDILKGTYVGCILFPNLFAMSMEYNGKEVPSGMCQRKLHMKEGLLEVIAETESDDVKITVKSLRLTSLADFSLVAEKIEIRTSQPGNLEIQFLMDSDLTSRKPDEKRETEDRDDILIWKYVAPGSGDQIAIASKTKFLSSDISGFRHNMVMKNNDILGIAYDIEMTDNKPIAFEKVAGIGTSKVHEDFTGTAVNTVKRAKDIGWDGILEKNQLEWNRFWDVHDIKIETDTQDEIATRYCIFQTRGGLPPYTSKFSTGPRLLTGIQYNQGVFWDDDIYIFPYLTKLDPEFTRNHLLYRYGQLPLAKKTAKKNGYNGAQYPWATTGDGSVVSATDFYALSKTQIHVTADIAWSVINYYEWTHDKEFLEKYGAEILTETARFWTKRLEKTNRGYELTDICGPDEFHPVCNNNTYTNMIVRHNLLSAAKYGNASREEKEKWLGISSEIFVCQPNNDGIVEQFEGYFTLKEIEAEMKDPKDYKAIKQADVLVIPMLFPDMYTREQVRAIYEYYLPRTVHGSNLSKCTYSLVAAKLGMTQAGYEMFQESAFMALTGAHNVKGAGIQGVNAAMVPRIIKEGFAGLEIESGHVVVTQNLPHEWKSIQFKLCYKGEIYECHLKQADNGKKIICKSNK